MFCNNIDQINVLQNDKFFHTMVNLMFKDLTQTQSDKRFMLVIKSIIQKRVQLASKPLDLHKTLVEKIFKELITLGETRKYIDYLFRQKYERIDFSYLDIRDIYPLFKGQDASLQNQIDNDSSDRSNDSPSKARFQSDINKTTIDFSNNDSLIDMSFDEIDSKENLSKKTSSYNHDMKK